MWVALPAGEAVIRCLPNADILDSMLHNSLGVLFTENYRVQIELDDTVAQGNMSYKTLSAQALQALHVIGNMSQQPYHFHNHFHCIEIYRDMRPTLLLSLAEPSAGSNIQI